MTIKTALVVGGTSGIGLGIVENLLHRGIKVYCIGRREFKNKNTFSDTLNFIQADLTVPGALNCIQNELKNVNLDYIIFSVATETPLKIFSEITEAEYDYAFSLNVKIPFLLTKMLLNNLNLHARILFLTSRLSATPESGSLIYCMSKSALETFSTGLNKEFTGKIFASSIIPGVVDTEMQKRLREADPRVFPHTHTYQAMYPKLRSVKVVSEAITTHLCDTNNIDFAQQKVNLFENKSIANE